MKKSTKNQTENKQNFKPTTQNTPIKSITDVNS